MNRAFVIGDLSKKCFNYIFAKTNYIFGFFEIFRKGAVIISGKSDRIIGQKS